MFSRQQYVKGECTYEQYYRQFVTPMVKATVHSYIGIDDIMESVDKHLNDIQLKRWDAMHPIIMEETKKARAQAGEGNSLATGVCIAKQAAFMLREEMSC